LRMHMISFWKWSKWADRDATVLRSAEHKPGKYSFRKGKASKRPRWWGGGGSGGV